MSAYKRGISSVTAHLFTPVQLFYYLENVQYNIEYCMVYYSILYSILSSIVYSISSSLLFLSFCLRGLRVVDKETGTRVHWVALSARSLQFDETQSTVGN